MSTSSGENEMGLKKILDFTRLTAITILLLHLYYYCYSAFKSWDLTFTISDRLLRSITDTGLFNTSINSKFISVALLCISLVGTRGKKDEKLNASTIISMFLIGLLIYFYAVGTSYRQSLSGRHI